MIISVKMEYVVYYFLSVKIILSFSSPFFYFLTLQFGHCAVYILCIKEYSAYLSRSGGERLTSENIVRYISLLSIYLSLLASFVFFSWVFDLSGVEYKGLSVQIFA